jgi:hypothetical protein
MDIMLGLASQPPGRGLPVNGPRAYMTHATATYEDPDAPELATTPTRRIVSHRGLDATRMRTVPQALADLYSEPHQSISSLFQWLVVSVDVEAPFNITSQDLYPRSDQLTGTSEGTVTEIIVRDFYGPPCIAGQDPVASGCVRIVPVGSPLLDFSATPQRCDQCNHTLGLWQLFPLASTQNGVFLGDLSKFVSVSGYRFRLEQDTTAIIAVGKPGEQVTVSFMSRASQSDTWTLSDENVTIGPDGRSIL